MKRWFNKYRYWIKLVAMLNLGSFFFMAGITKLLYSSDSFGAAPFIEELPMFGMLAHILPYVEIVLGLLLINGVMIKFVNTIALGFILLFAFSNIWMISAGRGMDMCGCYGMAGHLTYLDAMIVDGIMAVLAITVFICDRGKYFNKVPWFIDKTSTSIA